MAVMVDTRPQPALTSAMPPSPGAAARMTWIWALVVVQLPFMFVASAPITPPDLWWTLKLGELIAQRGSIAQNTALTYAPHAALQVNAQWLAQVVYYAAYRGLGLEGVIVLTALL